jgi:hypothetical protein
VIENVSRVKTSIGSGFYVSEDGLLVTNYHVISAAVWDPDKYQIDLVYQDGTTKEVELLYLDVVHDLALVRAPVSESGFFSIAATPPSVGEKIYSFGNPQDLGFTIVEGNYNGPIRESRLEKLNFSGSLNPGMSGGPAINSDGEIVGVNVSTAGNQLSFLVPSRFVSDMLLKYTELEGKGAQDFRDRFTLSNKLFLKLVEEQILSDQQEKFAEILGAPLETVSLGNFRVPSRLIPSLKCWSTAKDRKEQGYEYLNHICSTTELIFVNSQQKVGNLFLFYLLLKNKGLNQFSFASTVENILKEYDDGRGGAKDKVTNYLCVRDFVETGGTNYWVNVCLRRYKKMPQLYDLSIVGASVDSSERALLTYSNVSAISYRNAKLFVRAFMEALEWSQ